MAKTPKTSATIGLYIETKREHGYFHVFAYPVFIGITPQEMSYIDQGIPLSGPIPSDRIRNMTDDTVNGLTLDDLRVNSQGNDSDETRRLYAFEVRYQDVYSIDARKAQGMAKTLTTIDKRMEALQSKYGYASTFGAYLLRVADAIGASKIVIGRGNASSYSGRTHSICELASGASQVDGMIKEWAERTADRATA